MTDTPQAGRADADIAPSKTQEQLAAERAARRDAPQVEPADLSAEALAKAEPEQTKPEPAKVEETASIEAAGLTADDVLAASQRQAAPTDPQDARLDALESRVADLERRLREGFNGKV